MVNALFASFIVTLEICNTSGTCAPAVLRAVTGREFAGFTECAVVAAHTQYQVQQKLDELYLGLYKVRARCEVGT